MSVNWVYLGMRTPGHTAIVFAKALSRAERELEFFNQSNGEASALKAGDRVYFVTVEGEFTGTVTRDWYPKCWPSHRLHVTLDCMEESPIAFHRALFRSFTVLDHMAHV